MDGIEILIVHGAWHIPDHYAQLRAVLLALGFNVHCPLLPSCAGEDSVELGLQDDADTVRKLLKSLVNNGKRVLLLMHSYGGACGTEALSKELAFDYRQSAGLPGGIIHLIYLCAFMLLEGESVASASHPDEDPVRVDEVGRCSIANPTYLLYNDLEPEEADRSVAMLVPMNAKALVEQVSYAPRTGFGITYIYCTKDKILYPEWQHRMVSDMKATGSGLIEETLESSHSPFLSMPKEVVRIVERICERLS